MTAPTKHQVILNPPHPGIHKDPKESYKYLYELWKRTGGYSSQVGDTAGLEASVGELNTLVGIKTNEKVQEQLDSKANTADLGTMSTQDADSVAITGGTIEVNVGASVDRAKVGGKIHVDLTNVGSVGSSDTDLSSYVIKANSLIAQGNYIKIYSWGIFWANTNLKLLKFKIGSTELITSNLGGANDASWSIKGEIIRNSATAGKSTLELMSDSSEITNKTETQVFAGDFATDLTVVTVGKGDADNDVLQHGFIIEWQ